MTHLSPLAQNAGPHGKEISGTLFSCLCCCSEKSEEPLGHRPPFVPDGVDSEMTELWSWRLMVVLGGYSDGLPKQASKPAEADTLMFVYKDASLL